MKRTLTIILAFAAIACTKSTVELDNSHNNEITLTPVSGNITKAAISDGVFRTDNHIALYAYFTPNVQAGAVTDYTAFNKQYFNNTEFYCMNADSKGAKIWAGLTPYYWPATGSMVFAGYSLDKPIAPNIESKQNGTPSYDLNTDCLTITGYTQSNETDKTYDLLYFGRTNESFDRRNLNVPVVFKHALSWIELHVKGTEGALVEGRTWAITKVEFKGIATKGTFTYTGTETESALKAVWTDQTVTPIGKSVIVFNEVSGTRARQELTSEFAKIENVNAGTLIVPQEAKYLYVTIEYKSPANDTITEVIKVDIPSQTTTWESGKKYTYYLTFSPQEILIAPTVETWPDSIDESITL